MNLINRIAVSFLSMAAMAVGVLVLLLVTGTVEASSLNAGAFDTVLERMASSSGSDSAVNYVIGISLLLIGLFVLLIEVSSTRRSPRMVLINATDEGETRISLMSVRELSERTIRANRAVRNVRSSVRVSNSGLRFRCRVQLNMGTDVPAVSADLQAAVRDAVTRLLGLQVADVSVQARLSGNQDSPLLVR